MHRILCLAFLGLLMTLQPAAVARADDMATLVRDFDAFSRAQDPVRAAQRGDVAAARRWPDNSPQAVAARKTALLEFQQRLQAIPAVGLVADDALNRDLLIDRVDNALAGLAFDEERTPFISGDGFYTTADYAALNTPLDDEAAAAAWIARLEAIPAYYARETENMRRGIRTGFTQPGRTIERAIADVRAQIEQPAATTPLLVTAPCDSPFLPTDLVARLREALERDGAQLAVATTGAQSHPVFTLARRDVLPHLTDFMASGGRKIDAWYATLRVSLVDFADQQAAFSNINTREELAAWDNLPPG